MQTASCLIDVKPTLKQVWKQDELISAICVQSVDVHVSCSSHGISESELVLHRPLSQMIHCIVLYLVFRQERPSANKRMADSPSRGRSQDQAMDRRPADTQSAGPEPCDWSNTQVAPPRTHWVNLRWVPVVPRSYQFHLAVSARLNR